MRDDSEKWLRVLGLAPGATEEAINTAYRDLVKVWHPDRFGTDAPLRAKAEEKLRELNVAFEHLRNYRRSDSAGASSGSGDGRQPPVRSFAMPAGAARPERLMRGRIPVTVVVAALTGAVAVWIVLASRRTVETPPPPIDAPAAESTASAPPAMRQKTSSQPAPTPTTGSLRLESQPTGARVSFDGQVIGETPMTVADIAPGEHQVRLNLDKHGYSVWSGSVTVAAGSEEKLLAVLTPATSRD